MNELVNPAALRDGSPKSLGIVIIARHILTRTCIISILKREFPDFAIFEMATTGELDDISGSNVRLIALDIGDKPIGDPLVEDDLAALAISLPHVPVTLLSTRDDLSLIHI